MTAEPTALPVRVTPIADGVRFPSRHAFSVDLEEWYQVGAFEHTLKRSDWETCESRVELQAHKILNLLAEHDTRATFFCLGWVAERHPALIREIHEAGHEIACHGLDHQRLFTMDRPAFEADILASKKRLEDAAGVEVKGYRAPSFSLTPEVWWVYDVLSTAGFKYSSSLFPIQHDHYGMPSAPHRPFWPMDEGSILEIPMTVFSAFGRAFPASGGGYFRLLPYGIGRALIKKGAQQVGAPAVFYMHPWECDPGQPFVADAPWLSRFRHYTGQKGMPRKLGALLDDLSWGTMADTIVAPVFDALDDRA